MNETLPREPIRVPDLGIDDAKLTLSVWLVPWGHPCAAGDRVVEILTGEAVVDLPAASRGMLAEKLVPKTARSSLARSWAGFNASGQRRTECVLSRAGCGASGRGQVAVLNYGIAVRSVRSLHVSIASA